MGAAARPNVVRQYFLRHIREWWCKLFRVPHMRWRRSPVRLQGEPVVRRAVVAVQWGNSQNSGQPKHGEVHPTGTTQVSFNFFHPGTGNDYEWYWRGWWSKVDGWAGYDASAGWIKNTNGGAEVSNDPGGHTPSWARSAFGGQDADATMALYPWICVVNDDASKTGILNGAAMYAGDHGWDAWNCFCDNNGPFGSPGDSQPPPHYKLYSLKKEGDGWLHVFGVAGDAINPGVSNDDFYLQAFDGAW